MANNSPHSESLSVAPANSLSELGLNFYPIVPQRLREVYNMGSDDLHKSSSSEWDRVQNVVQWGFVQMNASEMGGQHT